MTSVSVLSVDEERWRPVVGFEGSYEVSDLGRVRSLDRVVVVQGKYGTYDKRCAGQMLAPQNHSGGYHQVTIGKKLFLVQWLVAAAFIGPRPLGLEVCHRDGVKQNNRASNLRYGDHVSNCAERREHGCDIRGRQNPNARISEVEVKVIRRLAKLRKQADVAASFGISQSQVSRIFTRKHWPHV